MESLRHAHLLIVLDYGFSVDEAPFIVMELVPGIPLVTDQGMKLDRFYPLFAQFLRSIGFIHDRGFLHRDLKPANALVVESNEESDSQSRSEASLMLLDFGLMERIGSASSKQIAGTPAYLPPEVVKGRALDPRADLYSLGITAFELLTGQRPFQHHDVRELLSMHEGAPRPRVSDINPAIPAALDELVFAMMAAEPNMRPSSADEVLLELSKLTHHVHQSDLESRKAYLRLADFVGRESQLQSMRTGLGHAKENCGECCFVAGRTGAGKSRLLNEIQMDALLRGFVTAGVEIREEYRAPYQSLRILLRNLVPLAIQSQCVPENSRVLQSLLPALDVDNAGLEKSVTPQEERGILIEETIAWLSRLAEHRCLLLIVDDLQWCDESSLLVFRAISRMLKSTRIVFLGAFRSDEIVSGSDLVHPQPTASGRETRIGSADPAR